MSAPIITTMKLKHLYSAIYSIIYITSSGSETLSVKALNYAPNPLFLPGYTSLLSNGMWLLMLPLYVSTLLNNSREDAALKEKANKVDQSSIQYVLQYIMMGILTFAITLLRNLSLNLLPGSVFSLLISTSIAFNMFLNFFFLRKSFNYWHLLAALLCVGSALSASSSGIVAPQESSFSEIGVIEALGASFFIAVMSVYQEHVQAKWADVNFRIIEMSLTSSFIASLLIILYSALSGELRDWKSSLDFSIQTREGLILVSCISIALPVLKMFIRNSKYSTIQNSSSFFFEFVQASSALTTSLASIVIFKEPFSATYLSSFFCMSLSFAAYIQAKRVAKKSSKGLVQNTPQVISPEELDSIGDPEVSTPNPLSPLAKGPQHDVVEFR